MKKILCTEVITKCNQVFSEKLTKEDLIKWFGENFTINNYVGISNKYELAKVIKTLTFDKGLDINSNSTLEEEYMNYEIIKNTTILGAYINFPSLSVIRESEDYDKFVSSGLYDYLLEKIGADFNRFSDIVDKYCGIDIIPMQEFVINYVKDMKLGASMAQMFTSITDSVQKAQELKILKPSNNKVKHSQK